ncbi:MAG: hemolysin III family protein [Clostridia bacterium]|nr:hemolysin III family protein [Clostridia bacterium]MBR1683664.1 hemolysin III family protein [Clostridia bacterium]MBR2288409.1 hemolysin III family protein [Clostridia bacterium]
MISDEERRNHKVAIPTYSLAEELMNSISHGLGALFGLTVLVLSIVKTAPTHDPWRIVSACIYGFTTFLLYIMSCLYHALKVNRAKRVFRVFDHCTIFLLIAGTYTPYTLVTLRPGYPLLAWIIFGIIWALAITGVVFNAINLRRFARVSVVCYLLMGWMIVIAFRPMQQTLPPQAISYLLYGGIAYSVGAILYGIGAKKKYFHFIFHLFCLAGTVFHFLSIYNYVF